MSVLPRYTLWIDAEGDLEVDDQVLARGLSLAEAADFIRMRDGRKHVYNTFEYESFISFELVDVVRRKTVLAATVPKTTDSASDGERALEMIDVQTIRRHRMFWSHEVSTDEQFEARSARIAARRAVRDLDQKIVSALIDRLLSDGNTITCRVGGCPVLERSKERAAILDILFDLDAADLIVHGAGETSWIELVFDEQGWDVIADYSADLETLVESIVAPYEPGNEADAEQTHASHELPDSAPGGAL